MTASLPILAPDYDDPLNSDFTLNGDIATIAVGGLLVQIERVATLTPGESMVSVSVGRMDAPTPIAVVRAFDVAG